MMDEETVKKYCEMAKGSFFFGKPVDDMSREELIAMAMMGWEAHKSAITECDTRTNILFGKF